MLTSTNERGGNRERAKEKVEPETTSSRTQAKKWSSKQIMTMTRERKRERERLVTVQKDRRNNDM